MTNEHFTKIEQTSPGSHPQIVTHTPISLFYKRRIQDRILYTMVKDNNLTTFEAPEYRTIHENHDFELMYVLKGQLTNNLEDKSFTFYAGDGCFLSPKMRHYETLEEDTFVVFINLSPKFLQELFNETACMGQAYGFLQHSLRHENEWQQRYLQVTKILPTPNKPLQIMLDALQQEIATRKMGASYFQKGLVLRIIESLQNSNRFSLKSVDLNDSKEAYLVNRIIHQIEHHYGNISRNEIEKNLHYNAEYLNRLLKKQTNKTISQYAKLIRTEKATQLLSTTNLTIQKIAQELGFGNDLYFYQFFKKQTGQSPNQYRKQHKNSDQESF
ncbi:AraC family transcriptional regulator [Enterococcus sp. JM4C]|uniref:AraC family transcriptional regulator n=1 Tax=Candidatus Enterococcus huntleyi TaxID=1857217 RepID=UPI00137B70C1|nr:AraC family transcriptional regulator [Enterococcus sp. JM4C]KAF1299328.1 AraC family transcriptional regulator [Enterococcus sp. JM4C]